MISSLYVVALSPSTTWNIHGFNTSQTSLVVDWSNTPGDLQADFFILSLNKTRPQLSYKDGRTNSFLRIVDSSNTSINVPGLPVFSQYIALVYLVDMNGDVYKSDTIVVQTDEGGKFIISQMTRFYLSLPHDINCLLKHYLRGDWGIADWETDESLPPRINLKSQAAQTLNTINT